LQREVAIRVSLLLAEAGEFAFVVIGVATLQYALIPDDVAQFMVIVAGTSMALTPLLALGAGLLGGRLQKRRDRGSRDQGEGAINIGEHSGHVIVAGFGRVGRSVAKLLAARDIPYVAVDRDLDRVREGRREGMSVVFGNAVDRDFLEKLGADHAALVLVALGDAKATTTTLQAIRSHWPSVKLLARAHDADHAAALLALGIEDVVPETLEASLQLGGLVLRTLGVPAKAVNDTIERARADGYRGHDDGEAVAGDQAADDQGEKTGEVEASVAAVSARPTSPGSV
jgi:CPA2 family monovalent cation:H+ antiporter-2